MKKTFTDWLDESKKLLKMLIGDKLYKEIEKTPLKSIDWKGSDITTSTILATCPNIKERFSEEGIQYFIDKDYTLLDMYLQCVFQFGYQQCCDYEVARLEKDMELFNKIISEELKDEKN